MLTAFDPVQINNNIDSNKDVIFKFRSHPKPNGLRLDFGVFVEIYHVYYEQNK